MNLDFQAPLPWTPQTLARLKTLFDQSEDFTVRWWWEPFHRVGFEALQFASTQDIDEKIFHQLSSDLSCAGVPKKFESALRLVGAVDADGRVLSFDAEPRIRSTWLHGQKNMAAFREKKLILPTISELRSSLEKKSSHWVPVLGEMEEFHKLSKWLTRKNSTTMKRFHSMSEWQQLELMEIFCGVVTEFSFLRFHRVYFEK